jgi:2-dehydropantoate 2-reductase
MSTPADFDTDQPAIVVENLQRNFGALKAVDGVSFTINHGSVVGFVGANGAGKTTTMRIMATLDQPTAGSVKVGGHNVVHYPEKVRRLLGWMPDSFGTYDHMTVLEYLDFYARALGYQGTERVQRIAQTFNAAGLQTLVSQNILGTVWDKLLINVATGAITAITGLSYGPLYAQPQLQALGLAAVKEAMAVAQAQGVSLSITDPLFAWTKAGAGLGHDFKTSMLQSLEKGSVTEIDYVNGAVVSLGARLGVPTPVNSALLALVKGLESRLG